MQCYSPLLFIGQSFRSQSGIPLAAEGIDRVDALERASSQHLVDDRVHGSLFELVGIDEGGDTGNVDQMIRVREGDKGGRDRLWGR